MSEILKNSYDADQIKVLSGLEGVRKRPAMYIGNTAEEGLHHLVYEVVDNSIDEALAGHCSRIRVSIHKDGSVSVEDNGRGIPVGIHSTEGVSALELVMCTLHAGGKFDHSTYKVSGGLHGVGVSVVNALSVRTVAEVKRDGKIHRQIYHHGIKEGDVEVVGETEHSGTKITFLPDPEIFKETTEFKYETIQARLRELAFLNRNVKILLHDERTGAEDEFHFKGGINAFVEYLNRNRTTVHLEPVFIEGERDDVQVEVSFQYFEGYTERLFPYVNNIYTREGGTHVVGFRAALTKCINRYASDDIIPKNLREKLSGDDVREGITCVISVRVPNPQFEGQTKTKLGNSEVKSIVETICHEKISQYLEEHPQEARKILGKAVDAARAREAARRAKELSRKKGSGMDLMMAAKLAECQSKKPEEREIFLVEGDSAGGSAKQGRDRVFQAILPLRGKIMNVEKARFDKVLSSEEIKQIIASLGTGIGREEFDISKLRYHKIIIMTDADVDGAHIRTLLLTFFYRQMLPLVEQGRVFIGQPPLYRLSRGKKEQFFLDDEELNRFLFQQASEIISVRSNDGRVIEGEALVALLRDLSGYQRLVDYLERLNLWEELLRYLVEEDIHSADQFENETLLGELHQRLSGGRFILGNIRPCRWRPSCYEFDVAVKDKAHLLTTIGPQIPLMPEYRAVLTQYPKISSMLGESFTVMVKNQELAVASWRELLTVIRAESFKGSSLQRYKGLGEMNPEQLWETTMNPENRILLRVNIEDAEKADEIFTTLMGDKVEPRREFIQANALEVSSLDI
ncbi:DNA topoisomerase (ATP-hydrolyzing) subunit B [Desulfurivibrio sp. D14AmB]|uniref:DNA topoisomerase (ATP-hydrolyzing) subunit B n=1 Tax=Desulfurivibrio sp. D14AmB TaxID=3374370 RepID=UPI00376EBAE5